MIKPNSKDRTMVGIGLTVPSENSVGLALTPRIHPTITIDAHQIAARTSDCVLSLILGAG